MIDLPEGSFISKNDLSHFKASSVLQATDLDEGTHRAQSSPGKCFSKILLNKNSSLDFGVFTGIAMLLAMISVLTLLPKLILILKPFGQEFNNN